MVVGGTPINDQKNSVLELLEVGESLQSLMSLKIPLAETAAPGVETGCTIVRRISKKDHFLACNSSFIQLVSLTDNNLVPAIKIPHSHPDKKIVDVVVHTNIIYTLAENDNKLGEIFLN
jgi:hypothetical protein